VGLVAASPAAEPKPADTRTAGLISSLISSLLSSAGARSRLTSDLGEFGI
jgi:hypothetical protein